MKTEGTEEDKTRKHHDANSQQANLSESTEGMVGKTKTIGSKTKPSQTKDSCDHTSTLGEERSYTTPKHGQLCCLRYLCLYLQTVQETDNFKITESGCVS